MIVPSELPLPLIRESADVRQILALRAATLQACRFVDDVDRHIGSSLVDEGIVPVLITLHRRWAPSGRLPIHCACGVSSIAQMSLRQTARAKRRSTRPASRCVLITEVNDSKDGDLASMPTVAGAPQDLRASSKLPGFRSERPASRSIPRLSEER